jgi:hypothetical protein
MTRKLQETMKKKKEIENNGGEREKERNKIKNNKKLNKINRELMTIMRRLRSSAGDGS